MYYAIMHKNGKLVNNRIYEDESEARKMAQSRGKLLVALTPNEPEDIEPNDFKKLVDTMRRRKSCRVRKQGDLAEFCIPLNEAHPNLIEVATVICEREPHKHDRAIKIVVNIDGHWTAKFVQWGGNSYQLFLAPTNSREDIQELITLLLMGE